jgi:hypothetical protein
MCEIAGGRKNSGGELMPHIMHLTGAPGLGPSLYSKAFNPVFERGTLGSHAKIQSALGTEPGKKLTINIHCRRHPPKHRGGATGASDVEIHDTVLIAAAFCQPRDVRGYVERGKQVAREGYVAVSKTYLPAEPSAHEQRCAARY